MGGLGSGRKAGRLCTSDLWALDVRRIYRSGHLKPGKSLTWQWTRDDEPVAMVRLHVEWGEVQLDYRHQSRSHSDAEWETLNYLVRLDWTACALGGQRVWWLCPSFGCGRRAAVLYGGRIFACRQCHRLAYRSQRETCDDRATRRADGIRQRLGWEPGILNGDGGRPAGMHQRTYWRLRAEYNHAMERALAGLGIRLGLLRERIERIKP